MQVASTVQHSEGPESRQPLSNRNGNAEPARQCGGNAEPARHSRRQRRKPPRFAEGLDMRDLDAATLPTQDTGSLRGTKRRRHTLSAGLTHCALSEAHSTVRRTSLAVGGVRSGGGWPPQLFSWDRTAIVSDEMSSMRQVYCVEVFFWIVPGTKHVEFKARPLTPLFCLQPLTFCMATIRVSTWLSCILPLLPFAGYRHRQGTGSSSNRSD